ncbi:unnamed protein product [Cladocopium goreaui]|uniref:DNA polymerase kappa n=1 Tax=Cladocopium goreaui TaxID=2562237 RepID=A0A9P1DLU2_9DINO|nr:unnamed protein product [Cladocopium goreaui]
MEGLPMTRGGLAGSALRPAGPAPSLAPCSTAMVGTAPPGRAVTVAAGAFAVAVAGKATLGGLLRRRRGQRETRATRVACAAVPTEKPFRTTLFTKAAPDGVSLGDCPFSHAVQIALKVKGVDYDVVPCGPNNKPPWLLQEVAGQMPCVVHQGIAHVETSQILKWIDMTFPGPSLAVPEDYAQLVSRAAIFPAVAEFTKNSDSRFIGEPADVFDAVSNASLCAAHWDEIRRQRHLDPGGLRTAGGFVRHPKCHGLLERMESERLARER